MLDAHPLDPPTADELEASLRAVLGPADAEVALRLAAREALPGLPGLADLGPEQLVALARGLIRQRGLAAIIGRSFEIRMISYLELPATTKAGPRPPAEPEDERLAALAALDLGDDLDDPRLTAAVARAADSLGLPIAAVSLVLDRAQYFAASQGLPPWIASARGTPDEWALCRQVVRSGQPFVVDDAAHDPRLPDNPLVELDHVRCYLGVPLTARDGQVLGTLCAIGTAPHRFGEADVARMRELADEVVAALEARRR